MLSYVFMQCIGRNWSFDNTIFHQRICFTWLVTICRRRRRKYYSFYAIIPRGKQYIECAIDIHVMCFLWMLYRKCYPRQSSHMKYSIYALHCAIEIIHLADVPIDIFSAILKSFFFFTTSIIIQNTNLVPFSEQLFCQICPYESGTPGNKIM